MDSIERSAADEAGKTCPVPGRRGCSLREDGTCPVISCPAPLPTCFTREDVEKAAKAIAEHTYAVPDYADASDCREWDDMPDHVRDTYVKAATAALAAIGGWIMVEATQEVHHEADTLAHRICGCATTGQHKADIAAILEYRQAAFNAGRASVLASPAQKA